MFILIGICKYAYIKFAGDLHFVRQKTLKSFNTFRTPTHEKSSEPCNNLYAKYSYLFA